MLPTTSHETARGMSLFSGVTEQDRSVLLSGGRIRNFKRGEVLFHHGDPVSKFYIINKGVIQVFRESPDGHEKTLHIFKAGQTLGENEILDACGSHRASAKVVEDAEVQEFPASWLRENARKYGTFAINLLTLISDRVHLAELEAEHQANMSAAQMVACFLQRLCVLYDFDPKGFDLPYSKSLIASRLGMELETFSRTLARLKEQGIVVNGNKVMINDLEKIEEYVCGSCSISGECSTHKAMENKICNK